MEQFRDKHSHEFSILTFSETPNRTRPDSTRHPRIKNLSAYFDELDNDSTSSTRHAVHYSAKSPDWTTPPEIFDPLNAEFGFTLDVAASKNNRRVKTCFTLEDDGLSKPWSGVCWMNPPYGKEINKWVAKAAAAADAGLATTVALLPVRTDTRWWHDTVWNLKTNTPREGVEVRFVRGRVRFLTESGEKLSSAPFPSVVVVWRAVKR